VGAERGQATVEWTSLLLFVALLLGAMVAFVPAVDGRSLGGLVLHRMVCAARGGCDDGDRELIAAYGETDAALVRAHAPGIVYQPGTLTLPVDFRACRRHACADAADDPELDVHRAEQGGAPATVFTHVARVDGETFIQYWLYYPDSTTGGALKVAWDATDPAARRGADSTYPGFHRDDWESYQLRIARDGTVLARSSSHHGYRWCQGSNCDRWGRATGWTRVSRGSHAGHLPLRGEGDRLEPAYPGVDLHERTSTPEALRLVPLERVDRTAYRPLDPGITPPWRKQVYRDPRSASTG
jgi:hypothetical protein